MRCKHAAMINLLGDLWIDGRTPDWNRALEDTSISLHLYGKADAKQGRKMGHMTITSDDRQDMAARLASARDHVTRCLTAES